MFNFMYNLIWTLVAILSLPLSLFARFRISERLGLGLHVAPSKGRRIWIHALSVGEVISAVPLVRALKSKFPDMPVIFSVKTSQGMAVAKKELAYEVEGLIPMPVDFWLSYSRLLQRINPCILMYVEGDVWPGLLSYARRKDIKTFLINGRISPRTFMGYMRFRNFVRALLNKFELCLMQSDIDGNRLIDVGVAPGRVRITGNVKFDMPWRAIEPDERTQWSNLLSLRPEHIVWVAGSTHEGEDRIIIDTYNRLKGDFPGLILIIAPRRIEAAEVIYSYSMSKGLNTELKSRLGNNQSPMREVLILDTIGELGRIYGLAHISFVGGSLAPIGGHNLLEPASFGCPVLFGEHTHNFQLMAESMIEAGGGWRVRDGEDLLLKMTTLLSDNDLRKVMGAKAQGFVLKNRGAIDRVLEYIGGYIRQNG